MITPESNKKFLENDYPLGKTVGELFRLKVKEKIDKYDFKEGLPQEFEINDFDFLFNDFSEELKNRIGPNFIKFYSFKKGRQHIWSILTR